MLLLAVAVFAVAPWLSTSHVGWCPRHYRASGWGAAQLGGYLMITLYEVVNVAVQVVRVRCDVSTCTTTFADMQPHPTITKTYWLACIVTTGALCLSSIFLGCTARPIIACICLGIVMLAHNFALLHEYFHELRAWRQLQSELSQPKLRKLASHVGSHMNNGTFAADLGDVDLSKLPVPYKRDLELARRGSAPGALLPRDRRHSGDSDWLWDSILDASLDSFF